MLEYVQANYAMIITVLFGISEALALIPSLKSNSVFQLIVNAIVMIKNLLVKPPAA